MAAIRRDIVNRDDDCSTQGIDKGVRNSWCWNWLEKQVDGVYVRDVIRKVKLPGTAYCIICNKDILYGNRGFLCISNHLKSTKHTSLLKVRQNNFLLPGSSNLENDEKNSEYGLHPMFHSMKVTATKTAPESLTPLADRVTNSQAMVISFIAEKSLAFSIAPDIIELAKALATDKKALDKLSMHRTAASYKLQYGVAKTFKEKLFEDLKTSFFSLNMDESTSKNHQKIVSVLVNLKDENKRIVTKHLSSFSVKTADSASLFKGICDIFETNDLPWENLVSVLLDSCNVMRGKKKGLETRIRLKCPNLLDIDGDSCHHAHNCAKKFCKPFDHYLESLFADIHNDLKYSPDMRAALAELCDTIGVKFTMPQCFVSYRWLSAYDCAVDLKRLIGPLTLFYFSFLSKQEKRDFLHIIVKVYKNYNINDLSRDSIRNLQQKIGEKNMTELGIQRKTRITQKLFEKQLLTKLIMGVFIAVLPMLKEYVLMFEHATPLIHTLHDKQMELLKNFLGCFVKPEVLKEIKGRHVKNLKLEKVHYLPFKSVFIGEMAKELISVSPKSQCDTIKKFQSCTMEAFAGCGKMLLAKMPITNPFLKAVSSIDPACRQSSLSLKYMKQLPDFSSNIIKSEEKELYDLEVVRFQNDNLRSQGENEGIDEWWGEVVDNKKYPLLSKLVFALLTCFHGPKVEASFSLMNNIVTSNSSRMNVPTFSAFQTVKYELSSQKKSAVSCFAKKDYLRERVDRKLCKNMRSSFNSYKEEQSKNRSLKEKKEQQLHNVKMVKISKLAAKKLTLEAAKTQRLKHQKKVTAHKKSKCNPQSKTTSEQIQVQHGSVKELEIKVTHNAGLSSDEKQTSERNSRIEKNFTASKVQTSKVLNPQAENLKEKVKLIPMQNQNFKVKENKLTQKRKLSSDKDTENGKSAKVKKTVTVLKRNHTIVDMFKNLQKK